MIDGEPGSRRSLMHNDAVVETRRLTLREVNNGDAPFILRLLNEPLFLQYIGDKDVHSLSEACIYIADGPVASYAEHGFGLYLVELKSDGTPIGTCGLLKRDTMNDPDIGFAFLPEYMSQGYAFESAQAVIERAKQVLGLPRILAITAPDNKASIGLLIKLGFVFDKTLEFFGDSGLSNLYRLETGD